VLYTSLKKWKFIFYQAIVHFKQAGNLFLSILPLYAEEVHHEHAGNLLLSNFTLFRARNFTLNMSEVHFEHLCNFYTTIGSSLTDIRRFTSIIKQLHVLYFFWTEIIRIEIARTTSYSANRPALRTISTNITQLIL
jgi:hypothetical protein